MNFYVDLAQKAVENYVAKAKILGLPQDLPKEIRERKAGTFVTIEKKGALRGCIGTYLPTRENIAREIIQNALAAASQDYRFGPIQKEELPYLSYIVYILSKPELVRDIGELDPKKYGIIVKASPIISPDRTDVVFNGHRPFKSGLLLPDLKGIDTVEEQISLACQKAGINPTSEKIVIYKFAVEKHAQ